MTDDRVALRRELRARRRAIAPRDRIAAAERLAARLLALPFFPRTGHVAGYWAMDGEIALHVFQLQLPAGCVYCLPILADDGCLEFAPWRPGDALVANRLGIPEPDLAPSSRLEARDLALVVMPLVGFDADGQRLGMGGGWYDRSFAFRRHAPATPWLVGAGFEAQRIATPLAAAAWDVRPDAICTEAATHRPRDAR